MSDYSDPENMPPPEAEGLDGPMDNEDKLDDTAEAFDGGLDDDAEKANDSDDESLLSDVDEAMLDTFDENKLEIAPDFEQLRGTKIKKRKRDENDEGRPKKKEKTRERARRRRGEEDVEAGEPEVGRRRKAGGGGERKPRERVEVDEETLSPEERRRRALDRAMDAAVKKSSGIRKRKGEIVRLKQGASPACILIYETGPRTDGRRRA